MAYELTATQRTELGSGASRRLRNKGWVPGILYGAGQKPVLLTLSQNELLKNLEREGFYSRVLTLKIDNEEQPAILKDLQRHPYRPLIKHLDLQRVSETEKLQMLISLHFINEDKSEGVKQDGGIVSHHLSEVLIRCLPKYLPEFIEVDLHQIKLNEIVHLSDLVLPENVELMALTHKIAGSDLPVASIHLARGETTDEETTEETPSEEQPVSV